jgi:outer membrane cobalamin receptor
VKVLYAAVLLLTSSFAHAQRYTISGSVSDASSGESLIGASIYNIRSLQGTTANSYGFYSISLPPDSVELRISYVGYEQQIVRLFLSKDTTINFALVSGSLLKEVVVSGSVDDQIQETTRMGTIDVPLEQIKAMPALLGEVDVLKVLQLLPGVQSGAEGSSGLYVRGGGPDQNLILLDGVPVYNASHLFGFVSVFNADAINHVELVKGGFPARYGGRLSSVIDIRMKEGNSQKLQGEGSVGLVASRLTIEGPIAKGKTSFIVSGRRTYIDLLASPLIKLATKGEETAGYHFYDLNAKINHRFNDKNTLYLSLYTGDDKAYARSDYVYTDSPSERTEGKDEFRLQWGNITTAIRWNSIINKKLFSNLTATYSRYRFGVYGDQQETATASGTTQMDYFHTAYISGIRDFALKADFDFIPSPAHYIRFGIQAIDHLFTPGVLSFHSTEIADTTMGATETYAKEYSAYVEDDFLITDKFKINGGIHASAFSVNGRLYHSVQPRVSARYLLSRDLSLKASYAQMAQYIHLLTNVGIGLPTDLWVPATATIGPEHSHITSAGLAYNLRSNYEITLEGYYKKMEGLIEYKDGANYLNVESDWQTKVESGSGESYGAELFLQKKTGKITGWVGYTLSWTNRTFANINFGRTFPYRYDRRHDVEIAAAYDWRENRQFALTWVYGTGAAVTLPQSSYAQYYSDPSYYGYGNGIEYYSGRNGYRMRAYHRLDLSYTTTKKKKWGERSWVIGVYNVYSRRNPFFLDIGYDEQRNKKFIQYSLFPFIPSIAYRFTF